jgi:hypothetical protein
LHNIANTNADLRSGLRQQDHGANPGSGTERAYPMANHPMVRTIIASGQPNL